MSEFPFSFSIENVMVSEKDKLLKSYESWKIMDYWKLLIIMCVIHDCNVNLILMRFDLLSLRSIVLSISAVCFSEFNIVILLVPVNLV